MSVREITAEFAAAVLQVHVAPGDQVLADQELLLLESMKTEIPVAAPLAGRVAALAVAEGDLVEEGQLLISIEGGL